MTKYLVYGIGRSGSAAIKLLHTYDLECCVVNRGDVAQWQKPEFGSLLFAEDDAVEQHLFCAVETIILSPGISRELPHLQDALRAGVKIISEIELAFKFLANKSIPIIAITGTNGKTTTTSLIGHLLRSLGKQVFIGGNIGTPFCQYMTENITADIIVLELSSFQLESMDTFHPHIALILNIFPNHGERYVDIESYAMAKMHILDGMQADDKLLYFENCEKYVQQYSYHCSSEKFTLTNSAQQLLPKLDCSRYSLIGQHNKLNLYAALWAILKLNLKFSVAQLESGLASFKGVEYRLQLVPSKLPYLVYNDAKSTNWDATLTALHSFRDDQEIMVIIGGQFRGHGDSILPYVSAFQGKTLLLIGETTDTLATQLKGTAIKFKQLYTLDAVKEFLAKEVFSGVLLLSPAFPSFDQFQNYTERGRIFTELFNA